jgi:protein-L-isoaspartate(D-aspartate) O-methyltransferase
MRTPIPLPMFLITLMICPLQAQESALPPEHPSFKEYVAERERMVETGIENYPNEPVTDTRVLKSMRRVPRHMFVPEEYREDAYKNIPLSIGYDQTISQPFIVAHMTQLLDIKPYNRVLEIGTGSGYQAAVLAELCEQVYTIEIVPQLGRRAEALLRELGYINVQVRIGDGYGGWPDAAPFDRIIVTCAPDDIPQPLVDQLAEGGRIVIPVGKQNQAQYMVVATKGRRGEVTLKRHYPVRFVPMTGKAME